MVRVGIMGCGSITIHRHAPEFSSNPNSVVAGFYDVKEERAKELAQKYGVKVYGTTDEMFSDKGVDAVCIATANHVHASLSIAALNAGKHVLCEKPIATSVNEAEGMISAARKNGKFLMIGHNYRFSPGHIRAKEILKSGEMGKILTFRTTLAHGGPEFWSADKGRHTWFFRKDSAIMGATGDMGIHKADLIRWLIDDEIVEVKAYAATLDKKNDNDEPIEVDDNMVAILKSKTGIIGTLTASWTYYGDDDFSTILYCSNGVMRIYDNPDSPIVVTNKNGEKVYYDVGMIYPSPSGIADAFLKSIMSGTPPEISGEVGMAALKIVIACKESQEKGTAVRV